MIALKTRRQQKGLSQRALARKAGLTYKTIQLLEGDRQDCRWSTLAKLAKALEISEPQSLLLRDPLMGGASTAAEIAARINQEGEDSWKLWLFEFVDAFRSAPSPEMIAAAPDPNTSCRMLALMACTVESLCAKKGILAPWWCGGVPPLSEPWFVAGMESLKAAALVESPTAFRQRNIFVFANFLSRA